MSVPVLSGVLLRLFTGGSVFHSDLPTDHEARSGGFPVAEVGRQSRTYGGPTRQGPAGASTNPDALFPAGPATERPTTRLLRAM